MAPVDDTQRGAGAGVRYPKLERGAPSTSAAQAGPCAGWGGKEAGGAALQLGWGSSAPHEGKGS